MEQQRLEELTRQNEAMRKQCHALQNQQSANEALAKRAVQIADSLNVERVRFPKNSQLQNYRTASAGYSSVTEIEIYLTYQMNRPTNKLDRKFGQTLIENLPARIEDTRSFLGFFCRYAAQFADKG